MFPRSQYNQGRHNHIHIHNNNHKKVIDPFLSILDFVSIVVLSLLALISVTNCPISIFQFHYISLHLKSPGAHKYLSAPDFTHSIDFFS